MCIKFNVDRIFFQFSICVSFTKPLLPKQWHEAIVFYPQGKSYFSLQKDLMKKGKKIDYRILFYLEFFVTPAPDFYQKSKRRKRRGVSRTEIFGRDKEETRKERNQEEEEEEMYLSIIFSKFFLE